MPKSILYEFQTSGNPDVADLLIESLDEARIARWMEKTSNILIFNTRAVRDGVYCENSALVDR